MHILDQKDNVPICYNIDGTVMPHDMDHIESNTPHSLGELMCVRCMTRFFAVWPTKMFLNDLVCPRCCELYPVGSIIATGCYQASGG